LKARQNNLTQGDTPPSFEQALERLEQIVACLEEGQAGLSESLAQYEEGVKLLRQCHEMLAQAERKIEVLAGLDAQGNPVTEPLDEAAGDSLEEKTAARSRRRSHSSGRTRRQSEPPVEKPDDGIPF
jgi:exodeoxyribonuclease VII small subunit